MRVAASWVSSFTGASYRGQARLRMAIRDEPPRSGPASQATAAEVRPPPGKGTEPRRVDAYASLCGQPWRPGPVRRCPGTERRSEVEISTTSPGWGRAAGNRGAHRRHPHPPPAARVGRRRGRRRPRGAGRECHRGGGGRERVHGQGGPVQLGHRDHEGDQHVQLSSAVALKGVVSKTGPVVTPPACGDNRQPRAAPASSGVPPTAAAPRASGAAQAPASGSSAKRPRAATACVATAATTACTAAADRTA